MIGENLSRNRLIALMMHSKEKDHNKQAPGWPCRKKGSCYHELNQRDNKISSSSSVRSQRDRWEVSWTGAAIFAGE